MCRIKPTRSTIFRLFCSTPSFHLSSSSEFRRAAQQYTAVVVNCLLLREKSITHVMETAAGVFVVAAVATSGHDNFAAEDEIPVGPAVALPVN
jgi:hypothetical protein